MWNKFHLVGEFMKQDNLASSGGTGVVFIPYWELIIAIGVKPSLRVHLNGGAGRGDLR
jgi:hypothetical protein